MGTSNSKEEEVIVSQAGNSGGATSETTQQQPAPTHSETFGMVAGCIIFCIVVYWMYRRLRHSLEKRMHARLRQVAAELAASRENV